MRDFHATMAKWFFTAGGTDMINLELTLSGLISRAVYLVADRIVET